MFNLIGRSVSNIGYMIAGIIIISGMILVTLLSIYFAMSLLINVVFDNKIETYVEEREAEEVWLEEKFQEKLKEPLE